MDNFNLKKYLKEDKLNENESILSDEEKDLANNMLQKNAPTIKPYS